MRWSGIRLPLSIRVDASAHPLRAGCRRDMQTEKYPKNDRKHQRKRGKKFLNVRRILFRRRQDKAAELPRRHAEIFRRQKKTAERRKQKRHWYAAHPATFFFGGKKKGKCGIAVRHNACINSQ